MDEFTQIANIILMYAVVFTVAALTLTITAITVAIRHLRRN